jgi:uncharacterized RDD family membrane protein YckC
MADDTTGEYGGFWIRLLAYVADCAILLLAMLLLGAVFGMTGLTKLGGIVLFVLQLLYWPVMQASARQATFGKAMLGLKVLGPDGGRLSFLRSLARELAKIASALVFMLGFVMAAFTGRKQALHDLLASTTVVRAGPAHVAGALVVSVVGLVGPMIAIPLLGIGLFAGMFGFAMKDLESQMRQEMQKSIQSQAPTRAPFQPAAPSAPQSSVPRAPIGQAVTGPDVRFDALYAAPLSGFDKPGTARIGPVILELSTVFPGSFWVKVYQPMPARGEAAGTNYHDAGSTF